MNSTSASTSGPNLQSKLSCFGTKVSTVHSAPKKITQSRFKFLSELYNSPFNYKNFSNSPLSNKKFLTDS